MTRKKFNLFSSKITQPKSQGASQAMLHATGLSKEDMAKPQVGISSMVRRKSLQYASTRFGKHYKRICKKRGFNWFSVQYYWGK